MVTVDELVRAVNAALGSSFVHDCPAADVNADGQVTIDELIKAVNVALTGCGEQARLGVGNDFSKNVAPCILVEKRLRSGKIRRRLR
jgi:hypothetical protein